MEGPEPNGVIAVFQTREEIESALEWLGMEGVDRRSVTVLVRDRIQELPPELDRSPHHNGEVARYWAKWGAALGGLAGMGPVSIALAAGAVGMGPMATVIAAGVGTLAASAGIGALAAGLVGMGVHERQAKYYEQALRDGKYVLVVHSDDPATLRSAKEELERMRAESVDTHGLVGAPPPRAPVREHLDRQNR
jgi:hypothetical protein